MIFLNRKRKFNYKNKTPLHLAAYVPSKEMVELLILKGADINAKDTVC